MFVFKTREGFIHFSQSGTIYVTSVPDASSGETAHNIYIIYNDEEHLLGRYSRKVYAERAFKMIITYMNAQLVDGNRVMFTVPSEEVISEWT